MNTLKKYRKLPLKTLILIYAAIGFVVVLIIPFLIISGLLETIAEISPIGAEKIDFWYSVIVMFYLVFLFLTSYFFWRKAKEMERREKELKKKFIIDPDNPAFQAKMQKIEKQKKNYLAIIEPVFIIGLGIFVSFLMYFIMVPIYNILSSSSQ